MIRSIILATLLLCSPIASPGILDRTVTVAFQDLRHQPEANLYEYSGFIVSRPGGGLFYTMFPHTDRKEATVTFDIKAHMDKGDTLVALYHNHPCHNKKYFVGYFSITDLISAKFHDVPTFMLDNCTGDVHKFDWSTDKVHDTGNDKSVKLPNGKVKTLHLPSGKIVGNIGYRSPSLDTDWVKLD